MIKTFLITCKGLRKNEEWFLGEGHGNTYADAVLDLATKNVDFRTHYNKVTGRFWGQVVSGRIVSVSAKG